MADCDIPSNVQTIAGPILLGSQLNWFFYGVLTVQMYMYQQAKYNDNTFIRSVVWFMYIFETLQTILLTHDTFHQLAISFGNMAGLGKPYLVGFELAIQSGIIACITQCFYAWRIYILSASKWFPMFIVHLSLLQCGGGIATGVACFVYQSTSADIPFEDRAVAVWTSGSAACDLTITLLMVHFLLKRRSGIRRTDNMVNKLIQVVVETGLATAAMVIVQLCMYLSFKDATYFLTPASVLPKAYSNSLLVLLNNRNSLRRQSEGTITIPSANNNSGSQSRRPIQVNIAQSEPYIDKPNIAMVNLSTDKSRIEDFGVAK
ncbi:hypothetical protein DAEQUDRAFT_721027 [Daedalea quercina L-15889]|uniref:DUF6534 domain-containing protein n=1 Tax=Daedalea quercina L-15889 TaxID=1314783 RepID=A0A165TYP1_9APHY|nr:hypothetical protein DAEQUDRAFT_721027 [Daedalea quercina L-15889]